MFDNLINSEIFIKANVLGNDFILIKTKICAKETLMSPFFSKDRIIRLADRKFGIGADQILSIDPNFKVNIWNADGSVARMCGNGLRALGQWIFSDKATFNVTYDSINLTTISGDVRIDFLPNTLQLQMPFEAKINKVDSIYYVDIGNLHKIHIVSMEPENFADYADDKYNVSCIWLEKGKCHARTFELGTGETLACGSAAFSIACVLETLGENNLEVFFKYGSLRHIKKEGKIIQEGSAQLICIGSFLNY